MRYDLPLAETLIDELTVFWTTVFGEIQPDIDRKVFLGSEAATSQSTLYVQWSGEQLIGTCFMMQSRTVPILAGFAEVATHPQWRGQGVATTLCHQAVADFRAAGGEAFFLGTVNPVAARLYHRLGWRKLAGANVMVNITSGAAPEEFLVDYFRQPGQVSIGLAGPDVRVPLIPLILTPHDSPILDANVKLLSCRYRTQNSCMGLYPRYVRTLQSQGAFFAARTTDGRVIGLATARPLLVDDTEQTYQVDGFVQHNFVAAWPDLLETACVWATAQGATNLQAQIGAEDAEKQAIFARLGFIYVGPSADFAENRLTTWQRVRSP